MAVKVSIRFKPCLVSKDIVIHDRKVSIDFSGIQNEFLFDNVLDETVSQEDVFRKTSVSIVDGALDGYNGCIFAYGQTGAGKIMSFVRLF